MNLTKKCFQSLKKGKLIGQNSKQIQVLVRKKYKLKIKRVVFSAIKQLVNISNKPQTMYSQYFRQKNKRKTSKIFNGWASMITQQIIRNPKRQKVEMLIKANRLLNLVQKSKLRKDRSIILKAQQSEALCFVKIQKSKHFFYKFFMFLQSKINVVDLKAQASNFYNRKLQHKAFYQFKNSIEGMKQVLQSSTQFYCIKLAKLAFLALQQQAEKRRATKIKLKTLPGNYIIKQHLARQISIIQGTSKQQLMHRSFFILKARQQQIKRFRKAINTNLLRTIFCQFEGITSTTILLKQKQAICKFNKKIKQFSTFQRKLRGLISLKKSLQLKSMQSQQLITYNKVIGVYQKLKREAVSQNQHKHKISRVKEAIQYPVIGEFIYLLNQNFVIYKNKRDLATKCLNFNKLSIMGKCFRILNGYLAQRKFIKIQLNSQLLAKLNIDYQDFKTDEKREIDIQELTGQLFSNALVKKCFGQFKMYCINSKVKAQRKIAAIQKYQLKIKLKVFKRLASYYLIKLTQKQNGILLQHQLKNCHIKLCLKTIKTNTLIKIMMKICKRIQNKYNKHSFSTIKRQYVQIVDLYKKLQTDNLPIFRIRLCFIAAKYYMKNKKAYRKQASKAFANLISAFPKQQLFRSLASCRKIRQAQIYIHAIIKRKFITSWKDKIFQLKFQQFVQITHKKLRHIITKNAFAQIALQSKETMLKAILQRIKMKNAMQFCFNKFNTNKLIKHRQSLLKSISLNIEKQFVQTGFKMMHLYWIQSLIQKGKLRKISSDKYSFNKFHCFNELIHVIKQAAIKLQQQLKNQQERFADYIRLKNGNQFFRKLKLDENQIVAKIKSDLQEKLTLGLKQRFFAKLQKMNCQYSFGLLKDLVIKDNRQKALQRFFNICKLQVANKVKQRKLRCFIISGIINTIMVVKNIDTKQQLTLKLQALQKHRSFKNKKDFFGLLRHSSQVHVLTDLIRISNNKGKLSAIKTLRKHSIIQKNYKRSMKLVSSRRKAYFWQCLYAYLKDQKLLGLNQSSIWEQNNEQKAKLHQYNQIRLAQMIYAWKLQAREARLVSSYIIEFDSLKLEPDQQSQLRFRKYQSEC